MCYYYISALSNKVQLLRMCRLHSTHQICILIYKTRKEHCILDTLLACTMVCSYVFHRRNTRIFSCRNSAHSNRINSGRRCKLGRGHCHRRSGTGLGHNRADKSSYRCQSQCNTYTRSSCKYYCHSTPGFARHSMYRCSTTEGSCTCQYIPTRTR